MMTRICGHRRQMIRVASLPFMTGMAMSMRITPGLCSIAPCTAARPSSTSVTPSMSTCASTSLRKPSATMRWSSAMRTRMVMSVRNPHGDLRPSGGQRPNLESPADRLRALSHRHHAETGLQAALVAFEAAVADAIVLHGHHAFAVRVAERDVGAPRAGMLGDVVEGLLCDAKQRDFDLGGRAYGRIPGAHRDRDPGSPGEIPRVPLQRRRQPVVVEHRRP